MSTDAQKPKPEPKRSAAEIEAENEARRAALAAQVDQLSDKLDPRVQAAEFADQAKVTVANATEQAKNFVEDVKAGRPQAVRIAGGVAAAVAAVVGLTLLRKRR